MADSLNYEDLARDAVDGMRPNSKRTAHYYAFEGSAMQLVASILRLPQVYTARLRVHHFKRFSVTIETNSTNC